MPHCPRCDTELPASARFCVQCGAAVADAPVDDSASSSAMDEGDEVTDLSMPTGDDTRVIDVELQPCLRCGASNAARRSRCGRCGARLAGPRATTGGSSTRDPRDTPPTGQVLPRPTPAVPPPQPGSDAVGSGSRSRDPRRRRRRRAVATAFVAGGLLVGAAIGVAAGSGIGPFASPVEVDFDAASYPDDPTALRPTSTGATSTHPPVEGMVFGPTRAVDGDPTTAWAPQAEDTDTRLVHHFEQPVWIDHIEVASGLPDDASGVGRVTGATIDLRTFRVEASIADTGDMQVIQLQQPVLVEDVTWKVTSTSGGPGALAEVRYRGWPADQADRDALQGR